MPFGLPPWHRQKKPPATPIKDLLDRPKPEYTGDLVQGFDALSLNSPTSFVGGFDPNQNVQSPPTPSKSPAFPEPAIRSDGPTFPPLPRPPAMPVPQLSATSSRTMQYALSAPTDASVTTSLTPPVMPPRPASGSNVPSPTRLDPQPSAETYRRLRASSDPISTASASSASGNGDSSQCSGITKAGKRCTRRVKPSEVLTRMDSNEPVERYCHDHRPEVLAPTEFRSRNSNGDWVKFAGQYPMALLFDLHLTGEQTSFLPTYTKTLKLRCVS